MGEQKMDYKISIAENHNYIIIKYYVDISTELSLKSGPELMHQATENDIKRFLFDMRESRNIQSVTDNYYFANEHIHSFKFPRRSRSAFLIKPSDNSHDFITTAFKNAGYVVAQFTNEDEAVKWLNSNLERKS
jgi:hypothetical protein